jgi:dipeptidyl-peptidase-4
MRHVACVLMTLLTLPAAADQLTLERIFADPALAGPTPRGVKISPDGQRVGLLRGRPADRHQLDLWTFDIQTGRLELKVESTQLVPREQLSDAELARRERERSADFRGILDYDWAPDGHHVLFTLGGNLYLDDLDAHGTAALRQLTHAAEPVIDPQMSPRGGYVSFVRGQNLWVIDLKSGQERRLTADGGGTIHNAEAEFIAQEELGQTSGYWWAPDDSGIAFKRFDESAVPIARRTEIYTDRTEVVEQRYPYAGDPNVAVKLGVVAATGGAVGWVDLGPDPDIYLVRADWTADGRRFAFQRLARNQKRLDLVLVDAVTLQQTPLLSETSQAWVNLSDDLRFLKSQHAFIWSSERSGSKHLYLYDLNGRLLHPLTAGNWNVDGLLAVDEAAGSVYFDSNRDAVIDRQIYVARLDGRDAATPHRISRGDGSHTAQFPQGSRRIAMYVDTFSNSLTPPQVGIHSTDGARIAWIEANTLDATHPYWPFHELHVAPQFGVIPAEDGQDLHYSLMKPANFDPSRRYPVLLRVYGGPSVQNVRNDWPDPFDEYMTQQGYAVFRIDNRGSARRGRAFQNAIHGRLGEVEVHDQLAGVRWLQSQPWIDGKRIGVFGWSYGGFMTLMLLDKASDVIAAGAAVAPVTDWRLYDTAYTERYLGTPLENPQGYADSSVFAALDGLRSPLLLAHGMADDNVLFVNSTRLMTALQNRGVQFELMTYPGAKHGLSTPQMKIHVFTAIRQFLDRNVKGPSPPATAAPPN